MNMAKRIRAIREAIQTEALVELLHNHAHGRAKLRHTELRAIETLLRKALPDLSRQASPDWRASTPMVGAMEPVVPPDPGARQAAPERS